MSNWFGKGCIHQKNKWEDSDRNSLPVLTFCNCPDNPEDTEGNCRESICPVTQDIKNNEQSKSMI
jgi:hypothetical protein